MKKRVLYYVWNQDDYCKLPRGTRHNFISKLDTLFGAIYQLNPLTANDEISRPENLTFLWFLT